MNNGYDVLQLFDKGGLFNVGPHIVHTVAAASEKVPPGHAMHSVPLKNMPAAHTHSISLKCDTSSTMNKAMPVDT